MKGCGVWRGEVWRDVERWRGVVWRDVEGCVGVEGCGVCRGGV